MSLPECFRVYKQKVTVSINGKDEVFELMPLSGSYYGDFMEVLNAMPKGDDKSTDEIFNSFNKDIISKMHMLLMQMFKESYGIDKAEEIVELDKTISKNLFALIAVLISVNLPNEEAASKE